MKHYIPLSDNATRQAIDSFGVFQEWMRSTVAAERVAGGMYFKPVQAERAEAFLNTPRFEQPIVCVTGRMALMRAISPLVFVDFKLWMSELENRPAGKRRRDKLQASIV